MMGSGIVPIDTDSMDLSDVEVMEAKVCKKSMLKEEKVKGISA